MNRRSANVQIFKNLCILGFLVSIFFAGLTMMDAGESEKIECVVMFLTMFVPILFSVYKIHSLAFALTGIQILIYTIYRIYIQSVMGTGFTWISYAWIFIPIAAVGTLTLYVSSSEQMENLNRMLTDQVEQSVTIEPVTGLYNRRVLMQDLERDISGCNRHHTELSLLLIELRYEEELRRILNAKNYSYLKKKLAEVVEDTIRVEDRLYAIDEKGSLAVLMITDKAGCSVVADRIKAALAEKGVFRDITNLNLRIDLRTGFLEYEENRYANALEFFSQVKNELQYNV